MALLKRYYPSSPSSMLPKNIDDNYHLIYSDVNFKAYCTLLQSDRLEQRVAGLSKINDALGGTRVAYNRKGLSDPEILSRLRKYNILEKVFRGNESHVQLIQRSEEVLRFLIEQNDFRKTDIQNVWNSVQKGDQQSKLEFYKVLERLSAKLVNEDISMIIEHFATHIPPEQFIRQEIDCVFTLSQNSQRLVDAQRKSCQLLWDIAC